jgi:hypothetical protein
MSMAGCDPINHNFKNNPGGVILGYINSSCFTVPTATPAIAAQCVPFSKVPGSCSNLLGNAGRIERNAQRRRGSATTAGDETQGHSVCAEGDLVIAHRKARSMPLRKGNTAEQGRGIRDQATCILRGRSELRRGASSLFSPSEVRDDDALQANS